MFVGAYWPQRKESREEAATRITRFVSAVASQGGVFSKWFLKGRAEVSARTPLVIDAPSIAGKLKVNRRDVGGEVMPELGFSLGIWNGDGVSLEATLGASSPAVQNSVVLSLVKGQDRLTKQDWRNLLEAAVRAFDPEHAVVTSTEHMMRNHTKNPWDAGWFSYERGGEVQEHPFE